MIHYEEWASGSLMVLSNPLHMSLVRFPNPNQPGYCPMACTLNHRGIIAPMAHLLWISWGTIPMAHPFPQYFSRGTVPHGLHSNLQPDNHNFIPFASAYAPELPHIPNYASLLPMNNYAMSTSPSITVPTKYSAIDNDQIKHDKIVFVYKRKLLKTQIPKSEVADDQFEKRWPKIRTIHAVQQGPYQFGATLHLQGPHYQLGVSALEEDLNLTLER